MQMDHVCFKYFLDTLTFVSLFLLPEGKGEAQKNERWRMNNLRSLDILSRGRCRPSQHPAGLILGGHHTDLILY